MMVAKLERPKYSALIDITIGVRAPQETPCRVAKIATCQMVVANASPNSATECPSRQAVRPIRLFILSPIAPPKTWLNIMAPVISVTTVPAAAPTAADYVPTAGGGWDAAPAAVPAVAPAPLPPKLASLSFGYAFPQVRTSHWNAAVLRSVGASQMRFGNPECWDWDAS